MAARVLTWPQKHRLHWNMENRLWTATVCCMSATAKAML
nr:MAG TPA: hypothetical protein [Caudoviricetes sp.]